MLSLLLSVALAAEVSPPALWLTAEPADVRLSYGEAARAKGIDGDEAYVICDDLAERLALCFSYMEGTERRYVTRAQLQRWGLSREQLRAKALERARTGLSPDRPEASKVAGGSQRYWTSAQADGLDVAGLLLPTELGRLLGEELVVAVPQRHVLLAWKAGDTELDTIMAVGARRMFDASEHPVSPLLYRFDGERWVVWGEATPKP